MYVNDSVVRDDVDFAQWVPDDVYPIPLMYRR